MITLGISLGFNSSASLWDGSKHLASISQERITGVRNTKELPLDAAMACFKAAGISVPESIRMAYTHYESLNWEYLGKNTPDEYKDMLNDRYIDDAFRSIFEKHLGTRITDFIRVNHHTAHEYSAYAVYGYEHGQTSLTMDGFGDGISARLKVDGIVVGELPLVKSPALYYQFVTGALGFKEHQHEGKITGLATGRYRSDVALVDKYYCFFNDLYNDDCLSLLEELDDSEKEQLLDSAIIDFDKFLRLKKTIYNYVKSELPDDYDVKDILSCKEAVSFAEAVQKLATDKVCSFLHDNRTRLTENIYLAGGLFANVAINRMFGEEYRNVYISPAMGDEGGAMGAALYVNSDEIGSVSFDPERIISAGLLPDESYMILDTDIAEAITTTDDKIVHLCSGRSEFGPRALMHRSSLFPATLSRHSDLLNRAMHRSEFMPYAPVCKAESCDELFYNWKPYEKSLHFMTVALQVKDGVASKYKAAVHKDGTCRVQVVHKDVDCERQAWMILDAYENLTGEKMLINTSFNIHNEPTCCTTKQCESAYERSGKIGRLFFKEEAVNGL